MDGITQLATSIADHPTAAMLACALVAIAYLYRDGRKRDEAHLESVKQIVPLATKLVTCVEVLERVTAYWAPRPPAPPPAPERSEG